MRDMNTRLERLEARMGIGACTCKRNAGGHRFFASLSEAEVNEAERGFAACTATHAQHDVATVVHIRTFGPEARTSTGTAPTRSWPITRAIDA